MKRLHKRFLLATFCALFTATLQAADVTITVNGRVVAKPCTIQTKEANVNLGDLYTRNLQQPGSASGWHNITLSLTDCPAETSAVTAIVTGSTDNTGYYTNEGTAEISMKLAHAFKAIVIPIRLNSILRAALPMKLPFFISFLPVNTGAITFPTAPTCAMNRQAWVWQRVSV